MGGPAGSCVLVVFGDVLCGFSPTHICFILDGSGSSSVACRSVLHGNGYFHLGHCSHDDPLYIRQKIPIKKPPPVKARAGCGTPTHKGWRSNLGVHPLCFYFRGLATLFCVRSLTAPPDGSPSLRHRETSHPSGLSHRPSAV